MRDCNQGLACFWRTWSWLPDAWPGSLRRGIFCSQFGSSGKMWPLHTIFFIVFLVSDSRHWNVWACSNQGNAASSSNMPRGLHSLVDQRQALVSCMTDQTKRKKLNDFKGKTRYLQGPSTSLMLLLIPFVNCWWWHYEEEDDATDGDDGDDADVAAAIPCIPFSVCQSRKLGLARLAPLQTITVYRLKKKHDWKIWKDGASTFWFPSFIFFSFLHIIYIYKYNII